MQPAETGQRAERILGEVERAVVGKREALELVLLGILADGHVLLEDFPGLAKTLLARSFAQAADVEFTRVQFTPDLLPADITGSAIFNQRDNEFEFRPGPIFTNLLLADEVNRAPPKTQAALLEAMQERQVTSGRTTRRLAPPFVVIATQNPIEYEGTYPLPEAQLDRFILRSRVGYPSLEHERELLVRRLERGPTRSRSRRSSTRRRSSRCSSRSSSSMSRSRSSTTSRGSLARRATTRVCRSAPAPAAAWRCSSCRAGRRYWQGAPT